MNVMFCYSTFLDLEVMYLIYMPPNFLHDFKVVGVIGGLLMSSSTDE
jgi:hypothetical protein